MQPALVHLFLQQQRLGSYFFNETGSQAQNKFNLCYYCWCDSVTNFSITLQGMLR